jgi:hypothetical protein
MTENTKNIDLQQASKEFNLEDIKALLEKFKTNQYITEQDFAKLDKNDENLSENENKIYNKLMKTKEVINILE